MATPVHAAVIEIDHYDFGASVRLTEEVRARLLIESVCPGLCPLAGNPLHVAAGASLEWDGDTHIDIRRAGRFRRYVRHE
jgi:hypothetical protein